MKDFTNVRQDSATISAAATAIGADMTPAQREASTGFGGRMDCTTPTTNTTSAMARTTVLNSTAFSCGVRSHHGTA